MTLRPFRSPLALLGVLTLLLGLSSDIWATESRSLVIAQAADFSGPDADFNRDFGLGAKIYFDYVNASGGINGHRIVYRESDTGGSSAKSVTIAQGFVKDGAQVLFGFTGENAVAAVAKDPAIASSGVPLFAPIAGASSMALQDNLIVLRTDMNTEVRALLANFTSLGVRSFGLVLGEGYGQDIVKVVETELARASAKLVSHTSLGSGSDGLARAVQTVAEAHPQAVIVLADTLGAAQFLKRYRAKDPGAFVSTTSVVNVRTLVSLVGPELSRGLVVSQVVPNSLASTEIAREHRRLMERYADEPVSQATLEGFIAAKTVVQLLRHTNDMSPAAVQHALVAGGRVDPGGLELNVAKGARASKFVEIGVVGPGGQLIR